MPGRIGSKSIEIMTTKFDQACNVIHCLLKALDLNGFTPNLTSNLCPVKLGVNPLRLRPPNSTRHAIYNLNEFPPKSTSIYLSEFPPNLTSNLCPVEFGIRPVEFGVNPLR